MWVRRRGLQLWVEFCFPSTRCSLFSNRYPRPGTRAGLTGSKAFGWDQPERARLTHHFTSSCTQVHLKSEMHSGSQMPSQAELFSHLTALVLLPLNQRHKNQEAFVFDLIVWQPSSRKDGDLLSSCNAVHAINGRDARLDHLLGVDAALRIDWLTCTQRKSSTSRLRFTFTSSYFP